ncbi:MAG: helix-turn-helix domain-containing protein [Symploca sp. SIO1C4]|uniref:Helix-turn-helix domain-containing protein n=1 Tax=Symploca sp. SIO1C4 TaxID=2607765 RepID=A0A6B3NPY2_9CYAN|nr:helix-turn-helix domain-containing protein [Symploca sp. SIO1C4]
MRKHVHHLERTQSDQLRSIGHQLYEVRQSLSYSIDEVSKKTLIQRRLLQAIEQGQLNQLPEPIYIQGFIRRYAEALGLDGNQVAAQFPTELTTSIRTMSWKDLPAAQLRPLHLYVAYILVILGAVSGLSHLLNRSTPISPGLGTPSVTSIIQTDRQSDGKKSEAPESRPAENPPSSEEEIRVEVTLTDSSWMLIVADDKTEFEGILNSGEQRTWTAEEELELTAGNAGGVLLSLNDGDAEKLGDAGSVQKITFSPDSPAAASPVTTGFINPQALWTRP